MQFRISQGPHAALGVPEGAALEQVRSAFLALTKQFHPARFGRLSIEIQRLSNEVFLGIKSAHDVLAKALGGGRRASMQSGGMPVIQAEISGHTAQTRPSGAIPVQTRQTSSIPVQTRQTSSIPVQTRQTSSIPVQARPSAPPSFARGTDRPSGPTIPRTTTPIQPSPTTTPIQPSRTMTPIQPGRTTTPPLGTPVQRPSTPPVMRPATPTGSRPGTPPGRPPTASQALNPDTVRGAGAPREPAFDERAALRESLMLVNDESWAAARQALSTLAARVPQSKNYRALLSYVRGREAEAAGRADEAALEYQRALELDPGLAMAKQALADVQRRR